MSCFFKYAQETLITIPQNVDVNGITFYDIHVKVGNVNWTVRHRYREFVDLHEKLINNRSISRDLLPPKKVIGNRNPLFLEQRQLNLEKYLQKVLNFIQFTMCREFVEFLDFNRYDIIYLLQDMAYLFFTQGDDVLLKTHHPVSSAATSSSQSSCTEKSYEFTTLELYAITERLKLPCPQMDSVEKIYDFSHVLDFCSQLDNVIVRSRSKKNTDESFNNTNTNNWHNNSSSSSALLSGIESNTTIGTSSIVPGNLKFDLNAFRNLKRLTIIGINTENICDAESIRDTLISYNVHKNINIKELNQIILCDCIHKNELIEGKIWKHLEMVNFSGNSITRIDQTIKLLPNLKTLQLDLNQIKTIGFLMHLPYLRTLSLRENLLQECIDCHLELGNLVTLNLAENKLTSLCGFRKMYSLVHLDVSCNLIKDIDEVDYLSGLQCLEELILTGNPIAGSVDYRPRVLSRFGDRSVDILLDNEKGNTQELDTALVLDALRQSTKGIQLLNSAICTNR